MQKVQEIEQNKSKLIIKSYANNQFHENVIVDSFDLGGFLNSETILSAIKELFEKIKCNKTGKKGIEGQILNPMTMGRRYIEIPEETKERIIQVAEKLKIDLKKDFFELGCYKDMFSTPVLLTGGYSIQGTDEEKEKYYDIIKLDEFIHQFIGWRQVEECYSDLQAIKFILCNEGTMYDEDIDIELVAQKDIFLFHHELKAPDIKEFGLKDNAWTFDDIFQIRGNSEFSEYSSSKIAKNIYSYNPTKFPTLLFQQKNYEEEFLETLDEIFEYDIFDKDEHVIIKVHVDYLKQHSAVAFPTPIFIKKIEENLEIAYRITSKNNPDIIDEKLMIAK